MTRSHFLLLLLGVLFAGLPGVRAGAQEQATLAEAQLVVQTQSAQSVASGVWKDQGPFSSLNRGDALRTGRRSKAFLTFRDGSSAIVNENSEIAISGPRFIQVRRGGLFANFRSPGTIRCGGVTVVTRRGGVRRSASAPAPVRLLRAAAFTAVSDPPAPASAPPSSPADTPTGLDTGTQVECEIDGDRTDVRCYQGAVQVYPGAADLLAGVAEAGTVSTLTDSDRVGSASLAGDTLRLLSGPAQDQERLITGFDPTTGTFTVQSPFGSAVQPGTDYLVRAGAQIPFFRLTQGMETRVTRGVVPPTPTRTFPKAFANGVDRPWFQDVVPGRTLEVYSDTIAQQTTQIRQIINDPGQPGNLRQPIIQPQKPLPAPGPAATGGAMITIQARPRTAFLLPPAVTGTGSTGLGAAGGLSGAALLAAVAESGVLPPALALPPAAVPRGANAVFDLEPYVVGADTGETVGAQARLRVARGNLLGTVATVVRDDRGRGDTDISEASVLYRTAHEGDFRVGRQLLFLGPANNDRIGSLLISYTVDGLTWDDTAGRRVGYRLGYLRNSGPLGGDNFPGAFGRAQTLLGHGVLGATVLEAHRDGEHVGASADVSLPLLGRALNGYLEAGRDPFERHLFTGGLYFPALFQRTGMDVFLEYQTRTTYQNEVSLRLSAPVRPNVTAVGYVTDTGHGRLGGGAALQFGFQR